ncbi:hypothetical protein JW835_06835 [bacterium]|nr:hypothetical protein [bacterium]
MPDLITHMAFSHLIIRVYELLKKQMHFSPFRTLFYIGVILPDILTRPGYILFSGTYDWTVALHTPMGAMMVCCILSFLFEKAIRKRAFLYLTFGALSHFILDALQKQLIYNNYWFFPFSWKSVGWGIAGAGTILEWIPVWLIVILIFEITVWMGRKRKKSLSE